MACRVRDQDPHQPHDDDRRDSHGAALERKARDLRRREQFLSLKPFLVRQGMRVRPQAMPSARNASLPVRSVSKKSKTSRSSGVNLAGFGRPPVPDSHFIVMVQQRTGYLRLQADVR